MKVKIGNRLIYFRTKVFNLKNDTRIGINSGIPFTGSHFLFLDYDNKDFDVHMHFLSILRYWKLKRGIILDSGNGFHCISFSPMPFGRMLEAVSKSMCCESYRKVTMRNGYATLRVSPKKNKKIRFMTAMNNTENGINFYDYDRELAYLEMIRWDGEKI